MLLVYKRSKHICVTHKFAENKMTSRQSLNQTMMNKRINFDQFVILQPCRAGLMFLSLIVRELKIKLTV